MSEQVRRMSDAAPLPGAALRGNSDEIVAARARTGDGMALVELAIRHWKGVYRIVRNMLVSNPAGAAEETFRERSSPRSRFRTVCLSAARSIVRPWKSHWRGCTRLRSRGSHGHRTRSRTGFGRHSAGWTRWTVPATCCATSRNFRRKRRHSSCAPRQQSSGHARIALA